MPTPAGNSFHLAFAHVSRAFPRTLLATLVVGILLAAVLTVVVVATVFAAAPTLVELIRVAAVEFTLAGQVLWTAALWALLPLAGFVLTGLIYLGSALIFADAVLRGDHVRIPRVLMCAVRRAGSGLLVTLAIIIGILPLGFFAVRWAFALPEVWLRGASPRAALRASWQRTAGRVTLLYLVLGGAYLAVIALGIGVPLLVGMLPWEHGVVVAQALCGAVLSPIPVLVLVQRWRDAGGTPDGDTAAMLRAETADAVRPVPGRGVVAGATSLTLVLGLLLPVGAASADTLGGGDGGAGASAVESAEGAESTEGAGSTESSETPAPAPAFAPASAPPVVQVTGDVDISSYTDPPTVGDPISVTFDADPDGLIPADVVVDGEFEVVNALDGTVLATGALAPGDRQGFATFPLRAWTLSIVARSIVETADARYELESAPVGLAADTHVSLYPTMRIEYATSPPTMGSIVTVHVTADPEGELPPGTPVNGPFELFENSGTDAGGHLVDGTFVDGAATVQFPITHPSMSIGIFGNFVSAEGIEFQFWSGGGGETRITVDPLPAQLTVSAPTVIQSGLPARVFAAVEVAGDSAPVGEVTFELYVPELDESYTFGPATQEPSGRYVAALCLQSAAPGDQACTSPPVTELMRVLPADVGELRLRAHFAPGSGPGAAWAAGTSDWHTLSFDPDGTTPHLDCRVLGFENSAAGNTSATPAQTAPLGSPTTHSHLTCESSRWDAVTHSWETVLGHRDGSVVQLLARPASGLEFVEWRRDGAVIGTSPTMNWTVDGGDHPSQVQQSLEAVYRPICLAPDIRVSGDGQLAFWPLQDLNRLHTELFPDASCQLRGGGPGVYEGTWVRAVLTPTQLAATGERAQLQRLSFGGTGILTRRTTLTDEQRIDGIALSFEVRRTTHWNAIFGPACWDVRGEGIEVLSESNCLTQSGTGFTAGSQVEVAPTPEALGEYGWVARWRVDGAVLDDFEGQQRAVITVPGGASALVSFDSVGCYPVTARVQEGSDGVPGRYTTGSLVTLSPEPNCGEASDRWLEGSEVTLTAVAGPAPSARTSLSFSAWSDDPSGAKFGAQRTVDVTGPVELTAYFYVAEVCSTVTITGEFTIDDLTFRNTQCGPGRYLDLAKSALARSDVSREEFETQLDAMYQGNWFAFEVDSGDFAVSGYAEQRVEYRAGRSGPWTWSSTDRIACDGSFCEVQGRGDVVVELHTCQTRELTVNIRYSGDPNGTVYSPEDFGLGGHEWVEAVRGTHPRMNFRCEDSSERWFTGSQVTFEPKSPAVGFVFDSWGEIESRSASGVAPSCGRPNGCARGEFVDTPWVTVSTPAVDPRRPDTLRATNRMEVNFTLLCSVPKIDEALAIIEPAPNCVGASASNPSYIDGTLLQLAANPYNAAGRHFRHFEGTIIEGTQGTSPGRAGDFAVVSASQVDWKLQARVDYPSVLAVAGPDTTVWGWYQYPPSNFENFVGSVANGSKLVVGAAAIAAGALIAVCAPCAGAVAVVTVAEVVTRALGADVAANIFAMLNPSYVLDCVTRWGFQSLPQSTTTQAGTAEGARSGAGIAGGALVRGVKAVYVTPEARAFIDKSSERIRYGGAAAGVALALYSAEVYNFDFTQTSAKDLRDTAAFLSCLSNTYG